MSATPHCVLQEAQEAMHWLYRLSHADRQERAVFLLWLCRSPQHVREFLLAATWDLVLCDLEPAANTLSRGIPVGHR